MDITIYPRLLSGEITAIPSKSQAHRLLICAAFADRETTLICPQTNQDIEATAACLNALGAWITRTKNGYRILPVTNIPKAATLPCGESGSTLRFMLPIVGALGVDATFLLEGRLPQRPLSPLWEEMERMGCSLSRPQTNTVYCSGKLKSGHYKIAGNISSQYITGLLLALPLISGTSSLQITGAIESAPYIQMTRQALCTFGVVFEDTDIPYSLPFHTPGVICVEGDWSNAAFFLAANKLGSQIRLNGLSQVSAQGDRACAALLETLSENISIDASDIPDLIPILAVTAAVNKGATFTNIRRLRLKESDRVQTVMDMLRSLGAHAEADENTLRIFPAVFKGGTVDAARDHRIAMSAAIAATVAQGPVTILGAHCVEKSYPSFWEEYKKSGGHYEQLLR